MPACAQCGTENPDVAKFCLACGSPLAAAAPPQEFRKVVTIVFSDLKGSTSMGEKLDSESLREVMTRYFDAMRAELEQHGGVVEKFIGDAVMAVFGLPRLHEDDALRAVRAAAGMQRALGELNDELERHWGVRLANRTGVNTGEVVAGDPTTGQRLVTGDAVNVAARLEQAAGEREVLLGDLTYRLVRDYVDVEEVEPLELKGKSEPVPAYRLVGVRDDTERPRRLDAPMVGRDRELEVLRGALGCAVADGRCRLVTVVGEAGVGKSRLIDEFVRSVEGQTSVLRGRCLPYGDGITFWPLAEAVRQASGIVERDTTESARAKLSTLVGDSEVEARVASAIGLSPAPFPVEELIWGARKLLESLARTRPLLVLFEDIHWAEPTFLELIEHVVDAADNAALLVICSTRHELVERRPEWSTAEGAERIELARLTEDEAGAVAEHLLGMAGLDDRIRSHIVRAAEGNPLFVEQLLSMLIDEGLISFEDGAWVPTAEIDSVSVPPTIQALLAARLDYLEPAERAVIEPAAVIGQVFVQGAVRHLVTEQVRPEVGARLGSLTDKQLVQPDLSRPLEKEAFRFHHILIRDTAYEGILKRARATFHEQFVEWADSVNREGATEYEEINGYHLEQAFRYLSELGPVDDHGRALGADGSRRLAAAGRRTFARGDMQAAANLIERAARLLPEQNPERLELVADLGEALMHLGRFVEARRSVDEVVVGALALGDETLRTTAELVGLRVRFYAGDLDLWSDEATREITGAIATFERLRNYAGLANAWRLLGLAHGRACRWYESGQAFARALQHARLAGDQRQQVRSATAGALAAVYGPTPVPEAIARCESLLEDVAGERQAEGAVLCCLANLEAMRGDFDRAREHYGQARVLLHDLGLRVEAASVSLDAARVELLAADPAAAEGELLDGYEELERMGERYLLSTLAGLRAQALYAQNRYDEAEAFAQAADELTAADDVESQALWRCVLAKVLARRGDSADAEALAARAIELLAETDAIAWQADAFFDLAEVLSLAGREQEAQRALESSLDLAERKGIEVVSARVKRALRGPAGKAVSL